MIYYTISESFSCFSFSFCYLTLLFCVPENMTHPCRSVSQLIYRLLNGQPTLCAALLVTLHVVQDAGKYGYHREGAAWYPEPLMCRV
jgi:hypothetical protein